MKQLKEASELLNKTIERTAYVDNVFCLFFTDKTFCIFKGCGWWDEKDVELLDEDFSITPNEYNIKELLSLGFISQSEADAAEKEIEEKYEKASEQKEIEQLKKLKAKYPDI